MTTQTNGFSIAWNPEHCLQCNICAYVCPTAALRPAALPEETAVQEGTLPLKNAPGLRYALSVSSADCTGCGLCVKECPTKEKALSLVRQSEPCTLSEVQPVEFSIKPDTVRGSQFTPARVNPSAACPGCAQAIYLKLLTQLFGQRMVIAGAYGCPSAVELLVSPTEENPTAPLERVRAIFAAREELKKHIRQLYSAVGISARAWVEDTAQAGKTHAIANIIKNRCEKLAGKNEHADYVLAHSELLDIPSVWILGGDGIADADEQELRALLQSGLKINLLLFETGSGVESKKRAFAKTVRNGGTIYTAQIAVGADYKQTLLALQEAERYPGPALIVAYAPCAGEHIPSDQTLENMRKAVHNGAWELFRTAPETTDEASAWHTECQPTFQKDVEKWEAVSRIQTKHPMKEQHPSQRIHNFEEIYSSYSPALAIREAKRCLHCRERPCMKSGCPVHNRIPDFIEQVAKGNFESAYQILRETTCLSAVCGRVCQQSKQCEGSCVRGIKGQPVAIGNLERFVADWHRAHAAHPQAASVPNGAKVAVIGSGPSGIACAGDLADLGYAVTVYEKEQVLGGVLAYGIPEFRLPKEIVSHEIEQLQQKGVQFCTNLALGRELNVEHLIQNEGFAAVYLANGAGVPVRMNIPGEDAAQVCSAADYLMRMNMGKGSDPDENTAQFAAKRVAVVGGGNVAMDACRAAVRTGAEAVYVLYRRSETEMPADPVELEEARAEGVRFCFLTNPVAIRCDEAGCVTGVECVRMKLGEADESGRRRVSAIEGSEFVLDVDRVIMALGTSFDRTAVQSVSGLAATDKGAVLVGEDHASNLSGVFAGGDAVTGPASVIRAMGAGKKAAQGIHAYITAEKAAQQNCEEMPKYP